MQIMIHDPILIRNLELKNRLVMPPMQTDRSDLGHVTDHMVQYYADRARYSRPGLIISEHCCITEQGRASRNQFSIAEDNCIAEHRQVTDAIHGAGSRVFIQLNHAGNAAEPLHGEELVSASDVRSLRKTETPAPRPLTAEEIKALQLCFADAAERAILAGYDGVEIHSAHGYLLNQFYSPLTNHRDDAYGFGTLENRLRFLLETVASVRNRIGPDVPLAVRLGGADYMSGGSTEEDAVEACRLLEAVGVDLLDISGGMCGYIRPGVKGAGYFGSMTEKIKKSVSVPVLLTGGITKLEEAVAFLQEGKADLIGVGRALFRDAHWLESQQ